MKDVEGHSSKQQLVRKDAYTPHIDLVIVVLPLQELGRDVDRGATEGLAHRFGTDGPSEVTDLYQALSQLTLTKL